MCCLLWLAVCCFVGILNSSFGQPIGLAADPFQPKNDAIDARKKHGPSQNTGLHVHLPGEDHNPHSFPIMHHDSRQGGDVHIDLPGQHGNAGPTPIVHREGVNTINTLVPSHGSDVHIDLPGQHGNTGPTPIVHREGVNPGILLHGNIMDKGVHTNVDIVLQTKDQTHGPVAVVDASHRDGKVPSNVGDANIDLPVKHGNTNSTPLVHSAGINPGMVLDRATVPVGLRNQIDTRHWDNGINLGHLSGTVPSQTGVGPTGHFGTLLDTMLLKEAQQPGYRHSGVGTDLSYPRYLPSQLTNLLNHRRQHNVGFESPDIIKPLTALNSGMIFDIHNRQGTNRRFPHQYSTHTGIVPKAFDAQINRGNHFESTKSQPNDLEMYPASFGPEPAGINGSGGTVVLLSPSVANTFGR
ncbi:hypothetical protein DPMN_103924 [Dreissena polymorpha]|uniref:Uncharacterized protein n=1 Tax=Dreissena polymorpha TaxID=45954 RepID=A0A9D4H8S9_DREPO|nr:hypothetical protein DPMN_103924 [Dreissena polymorpha]